jgi:hypothetical protein
VGGSTGSGARDGRLGRGLLAAIEAVVAFHAPAANGAPTFESIAPPAACMGYTARNPRARARQPPRAEHRAGASDSPPPSCVASCCPRACSTDYTGSRVMGGRGKVADQRTAQRSATSTRVGARQAHPRSASSKRSRGNTARRRRELRASLVVVALYDFADVACGARSRIIPKCRSGSGSSDSRRACSGPAALPARDERESRPATPPPSTAPVSGARTPQVLSPVGTHDGARSTKRARRGERSERPRALGAPGRDAHLDHRSLRLHRKPLTWQTGFAGVRRGLLARAAQRIACDGMLHYARDHSKVGALTCSRVDIVEASSRGRPRRGGTARDRASSPLKG